MRFVSPGRQPRVSGLPGYASSHNALIQLWNMNDKGDYTHCRLPGFEMRQHPSGSVNQCDMTSVDMLVDDVDVAVRWKLALAHASCVFLHLIPTSSPVLAFFVIADTCGTSAFMPPGEMCHSPPDRVGLSLRCVPELLSTCCVELCRIKYGFVFADVYHYVHKRLRVPRRVIEDHPSSLVA